MGFAIRHWIDIAIFAFSALAIIACLKKFKKGNLAYKNYIILFAMIILTRIVQIIKRPFSVSSLIDKTGSAIIYLFIIIGLVNFYLGYKKEKSTK